MPPSSTLSSPLPPHVSKSAPANQTPLASIIFVHGLTGDRDKTWTAPGAEATWPATLLPEKIPRARILTFGYDAYVTDWRSVVSKNRIGNHARNLLAALATYREDDDIVGTIYFTVPWAFWCSALLTPLEQPSDHIRRS